MTAVDPTRCPLCGRLNACALAQPGGPAAGPCWCAGVVVCPNALARVPAPARDRACLCADCARGAGFATPPTGAGVRP